MPGWLIILIFIVYNYFVHGPWTGQKKEYISWTQQKTEKFLKFVKDTRFYSLYLLAWVTGMRMSELLGLQWTDIDFQNNLLHVRRSLVKVYGGHELQEPKTKLSKKNNNAAIKSTDRYSKS